MASDVPMSTAQPSERAGNVRPASTDFDFRILDYVSAIDQNITCPICHCPFIDAVRIDCDHTFCNDCLQGALRAQSSSRKTCPSCRSPAKESNMTTVPRFIRQMVDDLIAYCPNKTAGCDKQIRREDLQAHVNKYCQFSEMPCPSDDCDHTVQRRLLSAECLHGLVGCGDCSNEIMVKDLDEHQRRKCSARSSKCEHCMAIFPVTELDAHISDCPEAIHNCSAAVIGCKTSLARKMIAGHEESCPLVALKPTLEKMQGRIDDSQNIINHLRRKNEILEGGLSSMQTILSSASLEVSPSGGNLVTATSGRSMAETIQNAEDAPFDSATHHLLSLHEALREELDRLTLSISDLDARLSMTILNETLRIRDEMAHTNAALGATRMQLQWLTQARLQAQNQVVGPIGPPPATASRLDAGPRRLSDSNRQDTKL